MHSSFAGANSALGVLGRFLVRAYGEVPSTLQLLDPEDRFPVLRMTRATRSSLELTVAKKVGGNVYPLCACMRASSKLLTCRATPQELISGKTGTSLLKFLDGTLTTVGRKELTHRIESPLMVAADIEARYNALETCLTNLPLGTRRVVQ